MIIFTRLNRSAIAINPDLIERVESTPDTLITLVDDKKFLVSESFEDVIDLINDFRAYVIARSSTIELSEIPRPTLHLVPTAAALSAEAAALPTEELESATDPGVGADVIDYLTALHSDTETT